MGSLALLKSLQRLDEIWEVVTRVLEPSYLRWHLLQQLQSYLQVKILESVLLYME